MVGNEQVEQSQQNWITAKLTDYKNNHFICSEETKIHTLLFKLSQMNS